MEYIKSKIRDVYDFPSKGVLFRDLTTAFKTPVPCTSSAGTFRSCTATKA